VYKKGLLGRGGIRLERRKRQLDGTEKMEEKKEYGSAQHSQGQMVVKKNPREKHPHILEMEKSFRGEQQN